MRRRFLAGILVLLLLGGLGCSKLSGQAVTDGVEADGPVEGGTLHLSMFSAPKGQFNPILVEAQYDANIIGLVFNGLLTRDENLDLVCDLCERFAISEDHQTVTFHLRKGIQWHDGQPLTTQDVAFTFYAMLHPDYPGARTGDYAALVGVESMLAERDLLAREVEAGRLTAAEATQRKQARWEEWQQGKGRQAIQVTDAHTISFTTSAPYAPLLQNLAVPILPAHLYADNPIAQMAEHPTNQRPIGTGPFRFVRYVIDQYVELERHEAFHQGRPYIERIIYRIANQDVAIGQLKRGEIHLIDLKPSDVELVEADPNVGLYARPDLGYQYLGLNHEHSLFADKRVRQALMHAIDRQAIVGQLLKGHGTVVNGHIPPLLWAYEERVLNPYSYDPAKARELLAAAGWTERNREGYLVKDGQPFTFLLRYPSGNAVRAATAPLIQANLKEIGIKVELQLMEFGSLSTLVFDERRADAWLMGWNVGLDPDPGAIFLSNNKWGKATGWSNSQSERLVREGTRRLRPTERKPIYTEWSRILNDELPILFLYSQHQIDAVRTDRVKGLRPDARGTLWNVWEVWMPKSFH